MAAKVQLDFRGLKCPLPSLKLSEAAGKQQKGDVLEAVADCSTFENDVKNWCQRTKHTLLWIRSEGGAVKRVAVSLAYGKLT